MAFELVSIYTQTHAHKNVLLYEVCEEQQGKKF